MEQKMKYLTNWKTTLAGLGSIAWAALDYWHFHGANQTIDVSAVVTGIGLILGKDA